MSNPSVQIRIGLGQIWKPHPLCQISLPGPPLNGKRCRSNQGKETNVYWGFWGRLLSLIKRAGRKEFLLEAGQWIFSCRNIHNFKNVIPVKQWCAGTCLTTGSQQWKKLKADFHGVNAPKWPISSSQCKVIVHTQKKRNINNRLSWTSTSWLQQTTARDSKDCVFLILTHKINKANCSCSCAQNPF